MYIYIYIYIHIYIYSKKDEEKYKLFSTQSFMLPIFSYINYKIRRYQVSVMVSLMAL